MHSSLCRIFEGSKGTVTKYVATITPSTSNVSPITPENFTCTKGYGIQAEMVIYGRVPLILRSLRQSHHDDFVRLFQDPVARATFGTGQPMSREEADKLFTMWSSRWEKDGNPYSAWSIFLGDSDEGSDAALHDNYVGNITLGLSGKPGVAAFSLIMCPKYWHQGIGQEATRSIVDFFAGCVLLQYDPQGIFLRRPLSAIEATTWNQPPLNSATTGLSVSTIIARRGLAELGFETGGNVVEGGVQKLAFSRPLQPGKFLTTSSIVECDNEASLTP